MKWIDITKEKPKIGEKVLGFRPFAKEYSDEEFTVLKYTGVNSTDYNGRKHEFERSHVVSHWIRLNKPN